jgi:16S rRNA (cytosine967-C5)-methyltransferase
VKGLRHRAGNDPRVAALVVLDQVLNRGEDSGAALDKQLEQSGLMPSDKSLCTEMVYGVLRLHLRLEWFIRQMLPKPDKLPAEVLLALELAAYELAHMRIPSHASVNRAVGLLRNRFGQGLAGVANGVLRKFECSKQEEYLNPVFYVQKLGKTADSPEVLALLYAMPEWIVRLWQDSFGQEKTLSLLQASVKPAPIGIRVNASQEGARALYDQFLNEKGALAVPPYSVALPEGSTQPLKILQKEGRISRHSSAAYEALWAMQPESWQLPIWDACAGRGGKTMSLLESGISVEQVTDISAARLKALPSELARLGLNNAAPEQLVSSAEEAVFTKKFATVFADVPCSGLGTLAHRPEIRWRRTPEDIAALIQTQRSILGAAVRALMPGGRIVYMTCTLNPAENEEQIRVFMQEHPELCLEKVWQTDPASPLGEFFLGSILKLTS